jgi:hypothetical protein
MSQPDLGLPGRKPMHTRGGCRCVSLIVFLFAVGGLVAVGGGAFLYLQQREQVRAQFEPPIVLVTEPVSGASAPVGSNLFVSATAFGSHPIVRAELWADGELKETQNSASLNGITVFDAHFDFRMSEGPHLLFVRAVNAAGMIGQSQPIGVASKPRVDAALPYLRVQAQSGETLGSIAKIWGIDPATLQQLNPQLKGQEPEPDALVTVPSPPQSATTPPMPGSAPIPIPDNPPLQAMPPAPIGIDVDLVSVFFDTRPPTKPDRLQAQVKDCKVRLLWNDNSTNESGFEVWMAGLGLPPQMLVKLKSAAGMGAAWVEFPAPQPGLFSFWVEAFNLFARQPSNIVWVAVEPKCPTALATQLEIEALDMSIGGSRDKAYCYVSFENTPEARVPGNSTQFINVQGSKGDIAGWASGNKKFGVPVPTDGALDIAGECWGWSGKSLDKLGAFSHKFSSATWDGKRQTLEGGGFQIGIAIQVLGATNLSENQIAYSYTDPTIPTPYDLTVEPLYGMWNAGTGTNKILGDPQERTLTWKWDDGSKKIDGFKIYLDGVLYVPPPGWIGSAGLPLTVAPNERKVKARLPAGCGKHIRWEISAYSGEAESNLSKPAEFDLDKCPLYARVAFKSVGLMHVDGSCFPNFAKTSFCDTITVYMMIYANNVTQKGGAWWADLFTGPKAYQMTCGSYTFKQILQSWHKEPDPDVIVVPLYGEEPTLKFGTRFQDTSDCGAGGFGRNETLTMPRDQWVKFHQSFSKVVGGAYSFPGVFGFAEIDVDGYEVH